MSERLERKHWETDWNVEEILKQNEQLSERAQELEKQVHFLNNELFGERTLNDQQRRQIDRLDKENNRYRQALEFYSNKKNYIHEEWESLNPNAKPLKMSMMDYDDGDKARQALDGEPNENLQEK